MEVIGHIRTNTVGSDTTAKVEIDDADLAGLSPEARQEKIDSEVWECMCQYVDCWWTEQDD